MHGPVLSTLFVIVNWAKSGPMDISVSLYPSSGTPELLDGGAVSNAPLQEDILGSKIHLPSIGLVTPFCLEEMGHSAHQAQYFLSSRPLLICSETSSTNLMKLSSKLSNNSRKPSMDVAVSVHVKLVIDMYVPMHWLASIVQYVLDV
ncbi:hypothetical protein SO802_016753 [Lithocarpus litseifolius]|uniref:Uncharacterized protein n=1 Tax=Lithocarpus litseifolius TaxID=425828 RepID=A0AAW2CZH6_9ROSI